MIRKFIYILFISVATLFTTSCTNPKIVEEKPSIVVSILPLKYFVQQIADTLYQINVLVPPGSSPEMFEPTPAQMITLDKAKLYFAIGLLDFEKGLEPKLTNKKNLYVNLSKGVDLITAKSVEEDHHHHHGVDPHIWMSVNGAKIIAQNITNELCRINPDNALLFKNNLQKFLVKADGIKSTIDSILNAGNCNSFLIYHPALSYFAREYNLKQLSIEQEGKSPSVKGITQTISEATNVKAVLSQGQFDTRKATTTAKELNLPVIIVDPLSENWEDSMISIAMAITGKTYERN